MRRSARCLTAVAFLILAGCPSWFKSSKKWQSFSPPDKAFTVQLPGSPKTETRQEGILTVIAHGTELPDGAFMVATCDLPPLNGFDYSAGIRSMASKYSGRVLTERDWTINGATGREYEMEISTPKKGYASGRMVIINGRLYQMLVMGTNYRLESADVKKFFDSFQLQKNRAPQGDAP